MSTIRRRRFIVAAPENTGADYESPRPHLERFWTDTSDVTWRRQGQGQLAMARGRRLLRRSDTIVYIEPAHEVLGEDRDDLLHRLEEFWAGRAQPMADFFLSEFRDSDHRVLVMIVEHC